MKEAHLVSGEELEITTNEDGALILMPIKNQHKDWLKQFNAIADSITSYLKIRDP